MDKKAIKISVIVPIYNVEKYLKQCLDSIVNQTLKDIEIILINDGSKDNCIHIIEEYSKKDNRIIVINKENKGYGNSCNIGLKKATGEYIAIVEPDDYIDKKMFEDLYSLAKENNSDIVKSCFYENYETKNYNAIKKPNWIFNKNFSKENFKIDSAPEFFFFHPSIWSAIYKKEFLVQNNITFIEAKGAGWSDNPFQVATLTLAQIITYTPNAYYYWRKRNIDESKDLKDILIPFKRSNEIHNWLNDNKIKNPNILSNLYKREFIYTKLILGSAKTKEIFKCKKEFEKMVSLLDFEIINNSSYLTLEEKKEFLKIQKNKTLYFYKNFLITKSEPFTNFLREKLLYLKIKTTKKKIIFWGASVFLESFIKKYNIKSKSIIGIIDKSEEKKHKFIKNYQCFSPDEINKLEFDEIILTILNSKTKNYNEIKTYLKQNYNKKIKLTKIL